MARKSMVVEPIGWVRNGIEPLAEVIWEEITSEIVVEEKWGLALEGLEDFSHIIVVWWISYLEDERGTVLQTHPEQKEELPLVGIFATRSPVRPNPIGITAVKLLERQGNRLKVLGLDAYDGTPVLDIKPYLTKGDSIEDATVADWAKQLWERG
ncbi:MAG: tRNA (N6-threonylcarbamoyladenosine(37)-N6)-methyltransferase TrmO [Anaerolineae bacterium]